MFPFRKKTYPFSREELSVIDRSLSLAEGSPQDAHYVGASDKPPEKIIAQKLSNQRPEKGRLQIIQQRTLRPKEWQIVAGALHNQARQWRTEIETAVETTSHPELINTRTASLDLRALEEQSRRITIAECLAMVLAADLPTFKSDWSESKK